jgi:hypothetical protein
MTSRPIPRQAQHVRMINPFWLVVFAVLNACDLLTTYLDLQAGMREGNPLMQQLLASYGFSALILYKLLMVVVVSIGIAALSRGYPTLSKITLTLCNGLVLIVVISNFVQYQL